MTYPTIPELTRRLAEGGPAAEQVAIECLDRILDPGGEGKRTYLAVDREKVLVQARCIDQLRASGIATGPLAGIPVSIKDLLDVAGEPTRAGSLVLDNASVIRDAPVVARLRRAGAVLIGRTNMTEFAYSGVGLNPHHGTPRNPFDRQTGRVPGGSSSGAAVSLSDGMAHLAIGSDTGGSCRIPAALCGLVGFKPTAERVPLDGCVPLSRSYDSIGCLGRSVECVALAGAVMTGGVIELEELASLKGLRIAVPETLVFDDADDTVTSSFSRALSRLSSCGANVCQIPFSELGEIPELARNGGIVAAESYAWHADLLESRGSCYDPRVRSRIVMGREIDSREYIRLLDARQRLIAECRTVTRDYDALILPTVPIVAPPFSAFQADEEYVRLNKLLLRNSSIANALDRCAVSLPCHVNGDPPVGLTIMGEKNGDNELLRIAGAVERALEGVRVC